MIKQAIGAGLRRVYIKDSEGNVVRAYGGMQASGDPQTESIDVPGDDIILGTFNSQQQEELNLLLNSIDFDSLQMLTGATPASSPTGARIALGSASELNPPFVEVQIVSAAKRTDGTIGWLYKRYFKAQLVNTPVITQQNGSEVSCEIALKAFPTETDIEGNDIGVQRISDIEFNTNAEPTALEALD